MTEETNICEGDVVVTSYQESPYVIIRIKTGCRCVDYVTMTNCDATSCNHECRCETNCPLTRDDEPHMHFTCVPEHIYRSGKWGKNDFCWLNGYIDSSNGILRHVSSKKTSLSIVGHVAAQAELDL